MNTSNQTQTAQLMAEVHVWSRIGHTPITNRKGAYCDELVHAMIEVSSPEDAHEKVLTIMENTPHAEKGHFNIPQWWNQNTRSSWLNMGQVYQRRSYLNK